VLAEGAVTASDAEQRAQWEATIRATRAHRLTVTVPGWRRPQSSRAWAINTLAPVEIPALGISAELLIVQTTMRRARREGSTTELVLVRPDAFAPQPQLEPALELLSPAGVDAGGEE
jgi:prophage tail gpP-like protein